MDCPNGISNISTVLLFTIIQGLADKIVVYLSFQWWCHRKKTKMNYFRCGLFWDCWPQPCSPIGCFGDPVGVHGDWHAYATSGVVIVCAIFAEVGFVVKMELVDQLKDATTSADTEAVLVPTVDTRIKYQVMTIMMMMMMITEVKVSRHLLH